MGILDFDHVVIRLTRETQIYSAFKPPTSSISPREIRKTNFAGADVEAIGKALGCIACPHPVANDHAAMHARKTHQMQTIVELHASSSSTC
jgi:hypothetical protein